jgi:RNA polymerase sigma-70 factor (ECF subfamily)
MEFTAHHEADMTISIQNRMIAELPTLKAYATALTANHVAAAELVDATICRALPRLDVAANANSLRVWLCAQLRQNFRPARGTSDKLDPALTRRVAATAESCEKRLVMTETLRALFTLPVEQREAVMLVDVLGLTGVEASAVAGCMVHALRCRQMRGRAALWRLLSADAAHTINGRATRLEVRLAA